jgi:hypothetical protein
MPCASRLCLLVALGLGALFSACGGDDDGDATPTPTPTPTASPATDTPTSTGDVKTPGPDESPDSGQTPAITETPPPTGVGGTPAPRVQDVSTFFAQFPSPPQDEKQCVYNPSTRLIDCSDRGVWAPDPPPVGQDIQCFLMVADGSPVVIRCEVADPPGSAYYDVR